MEQTRNDLSKKEKLQVLESLIDRKKVNKDSKFNKMFKDPVMFDIEVDWIVISAELYTRKEAFEKIIDAYKFDRLWSDYDDDIDTKEYVDNLTEENLKFWYIKYNWLEECDSRIRCWMYNDHLPPTNFHKPVYYLDLD